MKFRAATDFFLNFFQMGEHLRHDAQKHAISNLSVDVGMGKVQAASFIRPITAFKKYMMASWNWTANGLRMAFYVVYEYFTYLLFQKSWYFMVFGSSWLWWVTTFYISVLLNMLSLDNMVKLWLKIMQIGPQGTMKIMHTYVPPHTKICPPWAKVSHRCYCIVVVKNWKLVIKKNSLKENLSKTECSLHANCYHFVFWHCGN